MQYIVTANDFLTAEQSKRLNEIGSILYKSKLLPIIAIETSSLEIVSDLNFVSSVYPSRIGYFLSLSIIPPVPTHILKAANLVGWQVKVAILDSGFNDTGIMTSIIDLTGFGFQDDVLHGTVVSKIVKAIAPGAQVTGIKISNSREIDEINVLKGLEEAYFSKVKIINCSFGFAKSCDGSCAVCQMVSFLDSKGILVVAAAGNTGPSEGTIGCPGNASEALTVGAVDISGSRVANYSGRGRSLQNKPDVLAPGTVTFELQTANGTSFSAPVVTGVAASVMQSYTNHRLVKKCICSSATDLGYMSNHQGFGLLNISGTLEVLKNDKSSSSIPG